MATPARSRARPAGCGGLPPGRHPPERQASWVSVCVVFYSFSCSSGPGSHWSHPDAAVVTHSPPWSSTLYTLMWNTNQTDRLLRNWVQVKSNYTVSGGPPAMCILFGPCLVTQNSFSTLTVSKLYSNQGRLTR